MATARIPRMITRIPKTMTFSIEPGFPPTIVSTGRAGRTGIRPNRVTDLQLRSQDGRGRRLRPRGSECLPFTRAGQDHQVEQTQNIVSISGTGYERSRAVRIQDAA